MRVVRVVTVHTLARQEVRKQSSNPFAPPKMHFTGKRHGKKDDRVMATLQLIYHASLFFMRDDTSRKFGFSKRFINGSALIDW